MGGAGLLAEVGASLATFLWRGGWEAPGARAAALRALDARWTGNSQSCARGGSVLEGGYSNKKAKFEPGPTF